MIMPNTVEMIASILKEKLTRNELLTVLEACSDEYAQHGICPFCGCEDIPLDRDGNEIEGPDVSQASEFREQHDEDCFIYLLESPPLPLQQVVIDENGGIHYD